MVPFKASTRLQIGRGDSVPAPVSDTDGECLALLSLREEEILRLAVDGRTDEQIAQALGIATSTINSYWVRIRGKLGPLSRTELVGFVLRHENRRMCTELIEENRLLAEESECIKRELREAQAELRAMRGSSWHLAALSHASEAILVVVPSGSILYANRHANRLFAAPAGALEGFPLGELAFEEDGATQRAVARIFEGDGPTRQTLGDGRSWYGRRRDGSCFWGLLSAEAFDGASGRRIVVTVREMGVEIETLLARLRKPPEDGVPAS